MIKSLQGLRVVGMLFIFFFHLAYLKEGKLSTVYDIFFYEGYFAVTFFFILSGLVMYKSLDKKEVKGTFKECIDNTKKKMKKMYPLHIITLTFVLLTNIKYGNNIKMIILSIPNILLLQSFIPIKGIYLGFNGVAWYLSSLMFCYFVSNLLYIKVFNLDSKNLIKSIVIIWSIQFMVVFLAQNISIHHWLFYINPMFRSIDFLIGMILGRILIENKVKKIRYINYSLVEVALVGILMITYTLARYVSQALRWGVYYTPILVLILYVFSKEEGIISKYLGGSIFVRLSKISFEFFMIHQIVIIQLSRYFKVYPLIGIFILLLLSLILSVLVKSIFRLIYSRKLQRFSV